MVTGLIGGGGIVVPDRVFLFVSSSQFMSFVFVYVLTLVLFVFDITVFS